MQSERLFVQKKDLYLLKLTELLDCKDKSPSLRPRMCFWSFCQLVQPSSAEAPQLPEGLGILVKTKPAQVRDVTSNLVHVPTWSNSSSPSWIPLSGVPPPAGKLAMTLLVLPHHAQFPMCDRATTRNQERVSQQHRDTVTLPRTASQLWALPCAFFPPSKTIF